MFLQIVKGSDWNKCEKMSEKVLRQWNWGRQVVLWFSQAPTGRRNIARGEIPVGDAAPGRKSSAHFEPQRGDGGNNHDPQHQHITTSENEITHCHDPDNANGALRNPPSPRWGSFFYMHFATRGWIPWLKSVAPAGLSHLLLSQFHWRDTREKCVKKTCKIVNWRVK